MTTHKSSRRLAQSWPYPRHIHYERTLRKIAAEWFAKKGFPVHSKYAFILDEWDNWPRNIILPEVADYIKTFKVERDSARQGFALHKYVHHGLSSQAMVFNLIGPLIVRNDYEPLKRAIEKAGLSWPDNTDVVEFEYEDRSVFNEDSGQPTSIDVVIGDPAKPALYVESKLVEKEFGGCSVFAGGDCDGANPARDMPMCYLHHVGRKYWTLLKKHGFLEGPMADGRQCMLAAYYQYFREVLFAVEKEGTFVLLCDERSPTFFCNGSNGTRGLIPFLKEVTPEHLRSRIGSITIQSLVEELESVGGHEWVDEFKSKYGLDS